MINFSEDSVFNLHTISLDDVNKKVFAILIDGEEILGAFKTVRDQVIFTNKRIITADFEGKTGVKKEIFTIPYARIQYFGIQTPGLVELNPDSELAVFFTNGVKVAFEFSGKCDILLIAKMIGENML